MWKKESKGVKNRMKEGEGNAKDGMTEEEEDKIRGIQRTRSWRKFFIIALNGAPSLIISNEGVHSRVYDNLVSSL